MLEQTRTTLFTVKGGSSPGPSSSLHISNEDWSMGLFGQHPCSLRDSAFAFFLFLLEKKLGEKWLTLHACVSFNPPRNFQAQGNGVPRA